MEPEPPGSFSSRRNDARARPRTVSCSVRAAATRSAVGTGLGRVSKRPDPRAVSIRQSACGRQVCGESHQAQRRSHSPSRAGSAMAAASGLAPARGDSPSVRHSDTHSDICVIFSMPSRVRQPPRGPTGAHRRRATAARCLRCPAARRRPLASTTRARNHVAPPSGSGLPASEKNAVRLPRAAWHARVHSPWRIGSPI